MTLWEMLDRTGYWQKVLIYERNNRGQNMPVFCGTVIEARRNGDTVWDYLPCKVEKLECSTGILDIRVRTENYDRPFEEFYSGSDKWGKEKSERPWRWENEIEEEKETLRRDRR